MHEIRLPRLNANDTTYVIVEWLKPPGSMVRAGETLVAVETSKTVAELDAEHDGVLHQGVPAGATCAVGATIALQFESVEALDTYLAARPDPGAPAASTVDSSTVEGVVLTDAARELVDAHAVPVTALLALGRRVIRARDVERVLDRPAPAAPGNGHRAAPGNGHQAAVAAVVERSHREIPAAFTVMRVQLDPAIRFQAELSAAGGVVVGLPELFVAALGRLDQRFPEFYAGRAGRRGVGVTMDAGTGLFVPVVPAAGTQSLAGIAALLMGYRRQAVRDSFQPADLAGADIALSLHHEPDVVLARPIIFPGQIGMLSIGGPLAELILADGVPVSRTYLHAGLAYDHRYVNGRAAIAFLRAVKALIEAPERLADPA